MKSSLLAAILFTTSLATAVDKLTAVLVSTSGSKVKGEIDFIKTDKGITVVGTVTGLEPGSLHGFHVHEFGKCGNDGRDAGEHFNPTQKSHGDINPNSHLGDLGNIKADAQGKASVSLMKKEGSLEGPNGFKGRAIIVHAMPDDLSSQPSGNSGARIACGILMKQN